MLKDDTFRSRRVLFYQILIVMDSIYFIIQDKGHRKFFNIFKNFGEAAGA